MLWSHIGRQRSADVALGIGVAEYLRLIGTTTLESARRLPRERLDLATLRAYEIIDKPRRKE